jgi:hypothetical protein
MALQQVTVIGTRMKDAEITSYLGYLPETYNKNFTQLSREVVVARGYFNKSTANKIKFYRLPASDYKRLTDGATVVFDTLKNGKQWTPDIAFMFLDMKEAEETVNKKYPYGEMDDETRAQYVKDISEMLGDKFLKVNLLD